MINTVVIIVDAAVAKRPVAMDMFIVLMVLIDGFNFCMQLIVTVEMQNPIVGLSIS